jgi:hypothetical protein
MDEDFAISVFNKYWMYSNTDKKPYHLPTGHFSLTQIVFERAGQAHLPHLMDTLSKNSQP